MSVVPGDIDTDRQPPMMVPLRHFLFGLGFLLAGCLLGVAILTGIPLVRGALVHVHLLLVGWVCVTIMGAMTQFVPVWSGVQLHSQRLARWQLRLVVVGLPGFAVVLSVGPLRWLPVFGLVVLAGFWLFVYNVARTLWTVPRLDATERHFAVALAFFVAVTTIGVLLAVDFTTTVFGANGITHGQVLRTHATLAVFGAILTTVFGALYQLGTMFTQTELHGIDLPLRRLEEVAYPTGAVALAGGRLVDDVFLARVGGLLVLVGLAAFGVVLARKLHEMRVPWTPMHRRYAVVPPAIALWVVVTAPAWVREPLAMSTLFGGHGGVHLLALGVVGFVVFGTLYHVVPFIVWVHRYSDRLGYESVPMVDDLYDDRIATADLLLLVVGTVAVVAWDFVDLPRAVGVTGGALVIAGVVLFVTNMALVVHRHSPHSFVELLFGIPKRTRRSREPQSETDEHRAG